MTHNIILYAYLQEHIDDIAKLSSSYDYWQGDLRGPKEDLRGPPLSLAIGPLKHLMNSMKLVIPLHFIS